MRDANDGRDWSEMDVADLINELEHGHSIEEAARLLCRSGTIDEVKAKADQLGLAYASRPAPEPTFATHKVIGAEVSG